MKKFLLLGVLAAALCGCKSSSGLPGGDRDAHGCIGSAGYTWSAAAGDCVRLWQAGIKLTDARDPNAVLAAYVILPGDGTKAELFLPKMKKSSMLSRSFTLEGPVWTDPVYRLERRPDGWRLFEEETLIYRAGNPPDASR